MRVSDLFGERTGGGRRSDPAMVVMRRDEDDLDDVVASLAEMGFQAHVYGDGGTALDAIETGRPAFIVHAYDLPDMDGATFHAAVQKRSGGRRIPTLAIMPGEATSDQAFGARTGITDYICRPFGSEAFVSRLSGLLVHDAGESGGEEAGDDRASGPRKEDPVNEPDHVTSISSSKESEESSRTSPDAPDPSRRVRVIGLGDWGIRGAELFSRHGMAARAIDTEPGVERAKLAESRRHRVEVDDVGDLESYGKAARALIKDEKVAEALAADADTDLIVLVANLAVGAGALAAILLRRLGEAAPNASRLVVARLPGPRSGPDERVLGLVALNAVLQAPSSSILLVQPPVDAFNADPHAPLERLFDLWALTSGSSDDPVRGISDAGLIKVLSTPGFLGWREIDVANVSVGPEAESWHEQLVEARPEWQPEGFDWAQSQTILPLARMPRSWLDEGGRRQFERLVEAAWDEAAPCTMSAALYVGDSAVVSLVSAGMPYPQGILALRDSVREDRERLAEKRRAAEALIPLDDDFFFEGADALVDPGEIPEPGADEAAVEEPEPEPEPELVVEEREPVVEEPQSEPTDVAEAAEPTVEERAVEAPEPVVEEKFESAPVVQAEREPESEAEPAPPAVPEIPELEPGPVPEAYEAALGLAKRILDASDLRAEVDLAEVRYALYDLLEILREEPESLLPEVFRPEKHEYFERHHVNVAVLSILTADLLKGSLSEVIDLGTSALLHDIGMVSTRQTWHAGVRLPPRVFDRAIKPHPEIGFNRLQEVPGMTGPIARVVLEEHERMDGAGYPEGLEGDEIDPGARILAVCDTLEALTHPRPFRDALPPGEALARLQTLGQYTLDGAIVNALTDELGELLRSAAQGAETTH